MWPLIEIAPTLQVWGWRLGNGVAVVASLAVHVLELRRRPVDAGLLLRLQPPILLIGLAGAHWYYLLAAAREPFNGWSDLWDLTHGTSIQGGLVAGIAALALLLRWKGEPLGPYFDVLSPGMATAQALTRLGCFAAGCCYGRPTGVPWAVTFTDPLTAAPRGVPLHPAQLYEAALNLALAWFLDRRLRRPGEPSGRVWWLFFGGWALIRFLVQFLRSDDDGHLLLGMAHSQYLALGMLAVTAVALGRLRRVANPG